MHDYNENIHNILIKIYKSTSLFQMFLSNNLFKKLAQMCVLEIDSSSHSEVCSPMYYAVLLMEITLSLSQSEWGPTKVQLLAMIVE